MQQTPVLDKSFEATAQLAYGTHVELDSTGRVIVSANNSLKGIGVVQSNNGATAPFQCTVRLYGIAQILSDGSGSIAPGDPVFPAGSGKVKKLTIADGANMRLMAGIALNTVAATANLLVDVLLMPSIISNAT